MNYRKEKLRHDRFKKLKETNSKLLRNEFDKEALRSNITSNLELIKKCIERLDKNDSIECREIEVLENLYDAIIAFDTGMTACEVMAKFKEEDKTSNLVN